MIRYFLFPLLVFSALLQAQKSAIVPPSAPAAVGPYSHGVQVGPWVYVSGQGARNSKNELPDTFPAQTKQCLENVKAVVETAGLKLSDVVYSQIYVADIKNLAIVEGLWKEYFGTGLGPARAFIGVKRMPTDTPVEINAVAYRDATKVQRKKNSVRVGGRVFLGYLAGKTPAQVEASLVKELKAWGLTKENLAYINGYSLNGEKLPKLAAAQTDVTIHQLPGSDAFSATGVAIVDKTKKRVSANCAFVETTLYCGMQIPRPGAPAADTLETLVKQAMDLSKDAIAYGGLQFNDAVAANVYVKDLAEFGKMNAIYATYFATPYPTRTTVQPLAPEAGTMYPMVSFVLETKP